MALTHPVIGATVPGPKELGELTLERVLGAGAFGIVFAAVAARTGDTVAVKFLQAGILADPHERQALSNEVTAASEIEHDHVLRLLFANLDAPDYPPYVVSEFADGGRLHDRIESSRSARALIPLELLAGWSLDLVEAMRAINARVLHRDLKPDNILFAADVLKVADFGLSKLIGAATRSVTFKGGQHVLYMAPEAWAGQRNEIQIDMYAAGIVLFEMATLEFPFTLPIGGADFEAYRRMHLLQVPRTARSIRADLPLRFSDLVQRLLAKRPEDRYQTWGEIVTALNSAFEPGAQQGQPAIVAALVEQASQRHRKAVEAGIAAEGAAREKIEQRAIDKLQQDEIVERLQTIVAVFNTATEGPKARMENGRSGRYTLTMPYAETASLWFFEVEPALSLDSHRVRFAARLSDSKGCGFNLLLKRLPTEQYGTWVVCTVVVNPISSRAHPRCERFGFDANEVVEIERGHHAMHIYVPEFSNDVEAALSSFIKGLYESRPR